MEKDTHYAYVSALPEELICPICYDPFREPTDLPCAHTFCSSCIDNLNRCPMCRAKFGSEQIKPASFTLRTIVNKIIVRCKYCQVDHQLGDNVDHLSKYCLSSPKPCTAASIGCLWKGTDPSHFQTCPYIALSPLITKLLDRIDTLEKRMENVDGLKSTTKSEISGGKTLINGIVNFNNNYQVFQHSDIKFNFNHHSQFWISFWINVLQPNKTEWRNIFHKGHSDQDRTPALWIYTDRTLHFRMSTKVDCNEGIDRTLTPVPLNKWTHILCEYMNGELRLYMNGQLDSQTKLKGTLVTNTGPFYVGKDPWFVGPVMQLADFRLFQEKPNLMLLSQHEPK